MELEEATVSLKSRNQQSQRAKRTRCQAIGDITRVTQGGDDAGDGGALCQRPMQPVGRVLTGRITHLGKKFETAAPIYTIRARRP
jgi:hypothetical protein